MDAFIVINVVDVKFEDWFQLNCYLLYCPSRKTGLALGIKI